MNYYIIYYVISLLDYYIPVNMNIKKSIFVNSSRLQSHTLKKIEKHKTVIQVGGPTERGRDKRREGGRKKRLTEDI